MVPTSHLEDDGEDTFKYDELIQSDSDLCIKHLNTLWNIRFEQHEPPTKNKVTQINLRDEANPLPMFISRSLSPSEKEDQIQLIREYINVFAWNYEDMLGVDPQIAVHRLNINSVPNQSKQQRQFHLEIMEAIESEVKKLIDSGFVREEQHPDLVANIIPVPKRNEKIRIYIDYRDLNAACPKDEFSLSITDVIINNTCNFERMSFMDGFSGYNQIKMYLEDEKTHLSGRL